MRKWKTHHDLSDSSAVKSLEQILPEENTKECQGNATGTVIDQIVMDEENLGTSTDREETPSFPVSRCKKRGIVQRFMDFFVCFKKSDTGEKTKSLESGKKTNDRTSFRRKVLSGSSLDPLQVHLHRRRYADRHANRCTKKSAAPQRPRQIVNVIIRWITIKMNKRPNTKRDRRNCLNIPHRNPYQIFFYSIPPTLPTIEEEEEES